MAKAKPVTALSQDGPADMERPHLVIVRTHAGDVAWQVRSKRARRLTIDGANQVASSL